MTTTRTVTHDSINDLKADGDKANNMEYALRAIVETKSGRVLLAVEILPTMIMENTSNWLNTPWQLLRPYVGDATCLVFLLLATCISMVFSHHSSVVHSTTIYKSVCRLSSPQQRNSKCVSKWSTMLHAPLLDVIDNFHWFVFLSQSIEVACIVLGKWRKYFVRGKRMIRVSEDRGNL